MDDTSALALTHPNSLTSLTSLATALHYELVAHSIDIVSDELIVSDKHI